MQDPSVKDASQPLFPVQTDDFNPFAQQQPWPAASQAVSSVLPFTVSCKLMR
jgi:hypothetical protein